jgi:hypothetical protein
MRMIKEYCKENHTCIIRTNTYAHQLEHFLSLFTEAKKDQPTLEAKDVEVVRYGGTRYKRTFGIEFKSLEKPSEEYRVIEHLECTM